MPPMPLVRHPYIEYVENLHAAMKAERIMASKYSPMCIVCCRAIWIKKFASGFMISDVRLQI